jgi:hypothetical protein
MIVKIGLLSSNSSNTIQIFNPPALTGSLLTLQIIARFNVWVGRVNAAAVLIV